MPRTRRRRLSTPNRKVFDDWRFIVIGCGLLIVAGVAAYANSLDAPLVYDDFGVVRDNPTIRQLWPLTVPLSPPPTGNPMSGRPVANLSMAIDYAFGGLDPRGYHVANLAIHIACALLMFGIIRRTLATLIEPQTALVLALVSALLWTVHPLNSEAVDHISARTESLMALCYVLTLYAAIRATPPGRFWTAVSIAACAVGMACKESMVTAPLMVMLYDRVFGSASWSGTLGNRRWLYAGLASTWGLFVYLNWSGPRGHSAGFVSDSGLVGPTSTAAYVANQARLIPHYLRLALWPSGLVFDYGMVPALNLSDVAGYVFGVGAAVAAIAIVLVIRPRWGFLGAWFVITLAPASSIVPIYTEVGAERRMYLPMMALVCAIVVAAYAVMRRSLANSRGAIVGATAVATLVMGALMTVTTRRNAEYRSPLSLWSTVIERRPHGRAHYNLAMALKGEGRRDEEFSELRLAAADYPEALSVLGVELLDAGRIDEGITELQSFIRQRPDHINVVIAHGRLADALFAQRRYGAAIPEYRAYLTVRPQVVSAWTNLGISFAATGDPSQAVAAFRKAASIDSGSADAHRNLANALLDISAFEDAAAEAREAIRLSPHDAVAQEILSLAVAGQRARPDGRSAR